MRAAWWWGLFVCLSGCGTTATIQHPDATTYVLASRITKLATARALGMPCELSPVVAEFASMCPPLPTTATEEQIKTALDKCVRDGAGLVLITEFERALCRQLPLAVTK